MLAKSVNDGNDTAMGGITLYPRAPTLYNFQLLFANDSVIRASGVTLARVVLGTLIGLVVQYSAAYAFTKKSFRGRSALLVFLIVPMYIGGGLIPLYILYSKIGLLNNFLVYVIPGAFSFYNMILIRRST